MSRTELAAVFLEAAGWGAARRVHLAGDASDRRYERLFQAKASAILMDAPPGRGDDPACFIAIDRHLRSLGLSAPEIWAEDLVNGFLLLEDLGDDLYARLTKHAPEREASLYAAAVDVLLHLQHAPAPTGLPDLGAQDWAGAASFALDWYRYAITGEHCDKSDFVAVLTETLSQYADGTRVLILRDFHAENLLWLPGRQGLERVGLLDFQLAQLGQPAYDLVSLVQDARRDVSQHTANAICSRFRDARGDDDTTFSAAFAALGAQRALRILGIFARLCLHHGKPQYVALIPRVWNQLQMNLRHPKLSELSELCDRLLPEPTSERLDRIATQCKSPTP